MNLPNMNFISPFNELYYSPNCIDSSPTRFIHLSDFVCIPLVTILQKVESFTFHFSAPKLLNNTTALVLITVYSLVTMTILNLIWTKILSNLFLFIQSSMKFFPLRFGFFCLFCMCVFGYTLLPFFCP